MATDFHFGNDVGNLAFFIDDEGDSIRESSVREDAICFGNLLVGVAQQRKIEIQLLCKLDVGFDRITAGAKVSDVEFTEGFAALTERLAFDSSARRIGLRVPGYDHSRLALELR